MGAIKHIRHYHDIFGDPTRYYLHKAMPYREVPLQSFNDNCREFQPVLHLILRTAMIERCRGTEALAGLHDRRAETRATYV